MTEGVLFECAPSNPVAVTHRRLAGWKYAWRPVHSAAFRGNSPPTIHADRDPRPFQPVHEADRCELAPLPATTLSKATCSSAPASLGKNGCP